MSKKYIVIRVDFLISNPYITTSPIDEFDKLDEAKSEAKKFKQQIWETGFDYRM